MCRDLWDDDDSTDLRDDDTDLGMMVVDTDLWDDGGGTELRDDGECGTDLWDDDSTDLWDDGELGPEIVESDVADVDVVYVDAAARRLDDAEQRQRNARLTGARPPHYTNLQHKDRHRVNGCFNTELSKSTPVSNPKNRIVLGRPIAYLYCLTGTNQ